MFRFFLGGGLKAKLWGFFWNARPRPTTKKVPRRTRFDRRTRRKITKIPSITEQRRALVAFFGILQRGWSMASASVGDSQRCSLEAARFFSDEKVAHGQFGALGVGWSGSTAAAEAEEEEEAAAAAAACGSVADRMRIDGQRANEKRRNREETKWKTKRDRRKRAPCHWCNARPMKQQKKQQQQQQHSLRRLARRSAGHSFVSATLIGRRQRTRRSDVISGQ